MFDSHEPPKSFLQKLQERAAASRFFTVSLLLHVILIVLGGSVVLFKSMKEPPDFTSGGDGLVSSDVQVEAPPEQPPDVQQQFTPETPTLTAPSITAITTTATAPTFQVPTAAPVIKAVQTDAMADVLKHSAAMKGISRKAAGAMGRRGGTGRADAMKKNGGKPESEKAVLAGLRWLVKNQNSDGSWSTDFQPAMTGLALLCFFGHNELPASAEFGPTVEKGLNWLVENGKKNDGRLNMSGDFDQNGPYMHGIATYALGEYYAMTQDERVLELFKKAVGYIIAGQGPDGGWMYRYDKSESDTSVSCWQIQALKVAYLSGLAGADTALDKAMLNLKRVQAENGSFGYRKAGDRDYSLTGAGVLCTYFWKHAGDTTPEKKPFGSALDAGAGQAQLGTGTTSDKSVNKGIEWLISKTEKDHPVEYKHASADLYSWYYSTQACLMVGGAPWKKWNGWFQDQLIKNQSPDGSWPPMPAGGQGDLQKAPAGAGPFYRTTLCILMLEVYYRYSPSLKG